MRVKLFIVGPTILLAAVFLLELSPGRAAAQGAVTANSNSGKASRKPHARRASHSKEMHGVPSGVQNCIDHLIEMASKDPLTAYQPHPYEIINNGLLWDNPGSKCSIGSDQSLRAKVEALATAWQEKNAEKVRSLLQELKSAAPATAVDQGAAKPKKRTPRRRASNANSAKG